MYLVHDKSSQTFLLNFIKIPLRHIRFLKDFLQTLLKGSLPQIP